MAFNKKIGKRGEKVRGGFKTLCDDASPFRNNYTSFVA